MDSYTERLILKLIMCIHQHPTADLVIDPCGSYLTGGALSGFEYHKEQDFIQLSFDREIKG